MKYHNTTGPNDKDMLFSSYHTGPQGARFVLYRELLHTKEDIARAKSYLRNNFDEVSIQVEKD